MTSLYLWFKALHLIFMVCWFAGIFYLPRLFVYHSQSREPLVYQQLHIMERRLLYFITPFALLTVVFGIALIFSLGSAWFKASHWLHIKLILVLFLLAYHAFCFVLLKQLKSNAQSRSSLWFRIFNEVPVLALFAIILLAVLKPALG